MVVAPLLLSALLAAAAEAPLDPEARRYFGQQLALLVASVQSGLDAQGIHCVLGPGPGRPETPAADPASWLPASAVALASPGGKQPSSWQVFLACEQPGKKPFRMGVGLSGTPVPVPRSKVALQGDGFVVRDIGGNTLLLVAGRFWVFEKPEELKSQAQEKPPELARGVAVLVAAEEGQGTPTALEVLGKLEAGSLKAALDGIAALPAPGQELAGEPPPAAEPAYAAADEPPPEPVVLSRRELIGLSPLERILDSDELGYFAALRLRLREAVDAALVPIEGCASSSGLGTTESAVLTTEGFVPPDFRLSIVCGGGPRLWLQIALKPKALLEQDEKASQLAPGATLLESEARVRLVVGPLETASRPPSILPGLMRLGAVDIAQVGGAEDLERARQLFSSMDLAPLRALLADPPKPPASRKAAKEGEQAKGERAAVEAEVYRAIFDAVGNRQTVVMAETSKDSLGEGFERLAKAAMPDVLPSALEDFDRVAASSAPFPEISWRGPVILLTAKERKALFDSKSGDGWKVFRAKHPDAGAILTLSRVGLSRDRSQAVVAVAWQADWLAGAGEIWFLTRTESGWRVTYKVLRWVS